MRGAAWEAASEGARASVREWPANFGEVRQPVPESFRAGVTALVPSNKLQDFAMRFDLQLFVEALCCVAESTLEHFKAKLTTLFPNARAIPDVTKMREDESMCLMIANVKAAARVREKVIDAANKHHQDPEMWPFISTIGDVSLSVWTLFFTCSHRAFVVQAAACERGVVRLRHVGRFVGKAQPWLCFAQRARAAQGAFRERAREPGVS